MNISEATRYCFVIFSNFYSDIKISQKYEKLNCELFTISCCRDGMTSGEVHNTSDITYYVYLDCPKKQLDCLHSIACWIFRNGLHLETFVLNRSVIKIKDQVSIVFFFI